MPTPASQRALEGIRDLSTLEWYVIPLLAIVLYIYTSEIRKTLRKLGCDICRADGIRHGFHQ